MKGKKKNQFPDYWGINQRKKLKIPINVIPIFRRDLKGDIDRDGVPNYMDCEPLNPHKHGLFGKRKHERAVALFESQEKERKTVEAKIRRMKKSHPRWGLADFNCFNPRCGRGNSEYSSSLREIPKHTIEGVMYDPPLKCRACGGKIGYVFRDKKGATYTINGKMIKG